MKKLFFLIPLLGLLSCCKSDEPHPDPQLDLKTLDFSATLSSSPYSGILNVYPCTANSSIYLGNYLGNPPQQTSLPGMYMIVNGAADLDKGHTVTLPLGTYDMVYWGYRIPADTTVSYPLTITPVIRLGTDLKEQGYTLRPYSRTDTLYYSTEDFVFATKTVNIGIDGIGVRLNRVVAGLSVRIVDKNGEPLNASIDSIRVFVSSVAEQLDLYTAAPSNQTKTVVVPLRFSPSRASAYNTVTLFPSGPDPRILIELTLQNGERKTYVSKLNSRLTMNNLRILTLNIGEIYSSSSTGSDFEVGNWTESDETIDI